MVQQNMVVASRPSSARAKTDSSRTRSAEKTSCATAKSATAYHSTTMPPAPPSSSPPASMSARDAPSRDRNALHAAPATTSAAAPAAVRDGRFPRNSNESDNTRGTLSVALRSDCVMPGVWGWPTAWRKLPPPLSTPMTTSRRAGARRGARRQSTAAVLATQ